MQLVPGSQRMFSDDGTDPTEGRVRWAPAKSLWIATMTLAAIVFGPLTFAWDAFLLFVATSAVTLCFGHSVGMHRRLIHASFDCPLWLEHFCVYLGTLVGMAGPIGMVRIHDFRDWAQRQSSCHDYSCHRASFWCDAWWQLHCRLVLTHPPQFRPEAAAGQRPVLRRGRAHLDAPATPVGRTLLCDWRSELAGLGHLRARQCVRYGSLACGTFRPSPRRPKLHRRWRGRAGIQRRQRRPHQHG
jgi:hypothetical protein